MRKQNPLAHFDLSKIRKNLFSEAERLKSIPIADLFHHESDRLSRLTLSLNPFYFDFSKQNISQKALQNLIKYAKITNLKSEMEAMLSGEIMNTSEKRKVMHMALRKSVNSKPMSQTALQIVQTSREKCRLFANSIRNETLRGITNQPFRHIIHIGIGGSDLGPKLVAEALSANQNSKIKLSFITNVDPEEVESVLAQANPLETLVILVSKSFSTLETQMNAKRVLAWYQKYNQNKSLTTHHHKTKHLKNPVMSHFIAVTARPEKAKQFGIPSSQIFPFEDWIGGRYSIWSPVGLSIEIALGSDVFEAFLKGAHDMDQHFLTTEFDKNAPVLLALNDFWSRQFMQYETRAIIPYRYRLRLFPAYLQQLEMESNGKSFGKTGKEIQASSPIVWGGEGTNTQHAFFQLLHQGSSISPVHFIAVVNGEGSKHAENALLANCLAQSEALMIGRNEKQTLDMLKKEGISASDIKMLLPQKIFKGSRPSITILINQLTPYTLGQLIALYEHKVFIEGVLLNLNSFDQWGVELGKGLANQIKQELNTNILKHHDPSTTNLVKKILDFKENGS